MGRRDDGARAALIDVCAMQDGRIACLATERIPQTMGYMVSTVSMHWPFNVRSCDRWMTIASLHDTS